MTFDESGWAEGAIEPLAVAEAFSLLSPEASSRIDAGRWAHQARTSVRGLLELAQPKRYPSATLPLADAAFVDIVHLDQVGASDETPRKTRVLVLTMPLDRAPAARAAAVKGAEAIGGAGFDVLVGRGQRLWQVSGVQEGDDARAPLAVAAVLAAVLLAPIVPPGGGTIFGLKGARVRLEQQGWRT
jgi:hypothetical protein